MDLATNESRFEASDTKLGEDRFLDLPDGRRLGYTEFGDPLGIPLFAFHGTPGSRFMFRLVHEPARRLGLRIIAPDRPGFGLSDYQENGRSPIGQTMFAHLPIGSGSIASAWRASPAVALTWPRALPCYRKASQPPR